MDNLFNNVFPISEGDVATSMPQSSIFLILSLAPPLPPDIMAPAGAIISGGKGGAKDKIKKMEDCGIEVATSPSEIGKTLLNKLSN